MSKLSVIQGKREVLSLAATGLTVLSLVFYRILTASSFESTENVPLVTGLLAAGAILGVLAAWKDFFHVPSLLTFTALAAALAAFAAGRTSYLAFYLSGDVMNTGLSVHFVLAAVMLVLAVIVSIAAMCDARRKA
ncbi:MAG: hypothetical protein MR828_14200 [Clostridiales bacterium]|nr:hypothetical protein [Clostridiales bacterium]